jgi:hypothetical protein
MAVSEIEYEFETAAGYRADPLIMWTRRLCLGFHRSMSPRPRKENP